MKEAQRELEETARNLMSVLLQMKKIHFKGKSQKGIKHSELFVLMFIGNHEKQGDDGIRVSELGRMLRVKTPTVTQAVSALENLGMLERSMDSTDRRAVIIRLTPKGRSFFEENRQNFFDILGLVRYLGIEDSTEMTRIFKKVYTYFVEMSKNELNV